MAPVEHNVPSRCEDAGLEPAVTSTVRSAAVDRLTSNPSQSLIRVGPPHDVLQYDLVVREPGNPPRDYLFVFTVFYATDEETLVITDCEYDSQDFGPK